MVEIRWGSWCFRECRYERKLWGIFKRLTCWPASHPALHVLDLLAGSYSWKSKIQIRIFPLRLTVSRKIYCSRLFGLETLLLPLHSLDCIVSFIMVAAFYRDYTWLLLWKMLLFSAVCSPWKNLTDFEIAVSNSKTHESISSCRVFQWLQGCHLLPALPSGS